MKRNKYTCVGYEIIGGMWAFEIKDLGIDCVVSCPRDGQQYVQEAVRTKYPTSTVNFILRPVKFLFGSGVVWL